MYGARRPQLHKYNDVDMINERLYLGNINAASNLDQLKRLVSRFLSLT